MSAGKQSDIVIQHMIDLVGCECTFCSAREKHTGRIKLYLVFNDHRIYIRNGVKDTWDEVTDRQEYTVVSERFNNAVTGQHVPFYSTDKSRQMVMV